MRFIYKSLLFTVLLYFSVYKTQAQDINTSDNKGKFFIYWGWNRAAYSHSNITFKGDNYDFKLSHVIAKDRQTPWDPSIYLNPKLITIPQTNFKLGYFINDHYNLSFGVDHMKYVMVQNQTVKINGTISTEGSPYVGSYTDDDIVLTEDFLTFEHTDGLNYINLELSRVDNLLNWFGYDLKNIEVSITEGVGVGALLPKTNAKLFGQERHDDFHFSGYGLDAKVGLNITFFKYFFIQGELKGGFIHMPDIRTTKFSSDKASQAFAFGEADFLFGAIFKIAHRK
ncbi:MAG: hypothetical protein KDC79_05620 [Cyclobacteriaceae bacterium]|nr:hypothetical protein [Cyclobacteriaceae bacterium]